MTDKIIETPFTSEESATLRAVATVADQDKDFYKDKASKLFGIPYEEVTEEHRTKAKKFLMDYLYCRSNDNSFKSEVD